MRIQGNSKTNTLFFSFD